MHIYDGTETLPSSSSLSSSLLQSSYSHARSDCGSAFFFVLVNYYSLPYRFCRLRRQTRVNIVSSYSLCVRCVCNYAATTAPALAMCCAVNVKYAARFMSDIHTHTHIFAACVCVFGAQTTRATRSIYEDTRGRERRSPARVVCAFRSATTTTTTMLPTMALIVLLLLLLNHKFSWRFKVSTGMESGVLHVCIVCWTSRTRSDSAWDEVWERWWGCSS